MRHHKLHPLVSLGGWKSLTSHLYHGKLGRSWWCGSISYWIGIRRGMSASFSRRCVKVHLAAPGAKNWQLSRACGPAARITLRPCTVLQVSNVFVPCDSPRLPRDSPCLPRRSWRRKSNGSEASESWVAQRGNFWAALKLLLHHHLLKSLSDTDQVLVLQDWAAIPLHGGSGPKFRSLGEEWRVRCVQNLKSSQVS